LSKTFSSESEYVVIHEVHGASILFYLYPANFMNLSNVITSGRIVDIMVVFVVLEVIVLIGYWHRTGRGVPTLPLLANVGAGGSLMLALGAVLKGFEPAVIALCLVSSLVFHVSDLAIRWKR